MITLRPQSVLALVILVGFASNLKATGQTFEVLHSFSRLLNGDWPRAPLVQGSDGHFYGSTYFGGGNTNRGVLFKITADGAFTTLAVLNSTNGLVRSALVEGSDGSFYGTSQSGSSSDGTVFKMSPDGEVTTLFAFHYTNGSAPHALTLGSDGNFYGTTTYGGAYEDESPFFSSYGTIFKVTPEGDLTTLLSFNSTNGANPGSGMIQARDGNFYGTTHHGEPFQMGTVFRMTPEGSLTTIAVFDGTNGRLPGPLMQAADQTIYGTTSTGGEYNRGTIFRLSTDGTLTSLVSFNGTNGSSPRGLTQAWDGDFYGTTTGGGESDWGTIFRLTPEGILSTLMSFESISLTAPRRPLAGLTVGTDGNLYGTTSDGGAHQAGTIFRILMPGPRLNLQRSGNRIVIFWPTAAAGFKLQSTVDLKSPEWTDSPDPPVIVDGQYTVTNELSGGIRFYRLTR